MTRYLSLPEYLWLAEQVTGNAAVDLVKAGRIDLAESALRAPEAAFGGEEFHTTLVDKAAVIVCHPLLDDLAGFRTTPPRSALVRHPVVATVDGSCHRREGRGHRSEACGVPIISGVAMIVPSR